MGPIQELYKLCLYYRERVDLFPYIPRYLVRIGSLFCLYAWQYFSTEGSIFKIPFVTRDEQLLATSLPLNCGVVVADTIVLQPVLPWTYLLFSR